MKKLFLPLFMMLVFSCKSTDKKETLFIEAESFKNKGGWVLDQQFMDLMGSSYLMAHGMGVPVVDAETKIEVQAAGDYHLWVRTINWAAKWDVEDAPGKFNVIVNGQACEPTFGTENKTWNWRNGGKVNLKKGSNKIVLHDLTGFNGRCDALIFTPDAEFAPTNDPDELAAYRKKMLNLPDEPAMAGEYDMVVIGGGIAGTCAAISGARSGLKVALIQDRPVLGGNNSSEARVHLGGRINLGQYEALGDVVKEIGPERQGNARPAEYYEDDKILRVVRMEKNIELFLNYRAFAIEKEGNKITTVTARNTETSEELKFSAPVFVDCTGDGTIGYLAGADYRMGREGKDETGEEKAPEKADKMTMGSSVQWYSEETDEPTTFPECPWALQFNEETAQVVDMGEWDWEVGMHKNQLTEFEEVRDYAYRVIYGNWAFLKNEYSKKEDFANKKLAWVAYIAGKRESRRLLGDVILKEQDIVDQKDFPDACVVATWSIDLHYPDSTNLQMFPEGSFRSIAVHGKKNDYAIPYRCFYSRNIDNLFMAGRNISVTHVALGTVRVMRTTGMMGEVVGMAASLCKKHNCTPGEVYKNHLDELKELMTDGVGKHKLDIKKE